MRVLRIISHCNNCLHEDTHTILSNESDSMYQKCPKCKIDMTIDKMNLIYDDIDGNRIEECVYNSKR